MNNRKRMLGIGVLMAIAVFALIFAYKQTAPITVSEENTVPTSLDLAKLRGFNLQSKRLVGDWVDGDAEAWAFDFMVKEGFNFARIPMEVQQLYTDSKYTVWSEDALLEIDRIVKLGREYGVHILLDLHTLPGIRPGGIEPSDSAFDSEARLAIWKDIFSVIAKRYKDVPSEALSYNLINEPFQMDTASYMDAISQVRAVIRDVDSTKRLFIDPNDWKEDALYDLEQFDDPYLVASPHFYQPFLVTHYLAEWVAGSAAFPEPQYPSVDFNGYLYGDTHPDLTQPLILKGNFSKGTQVTLRINEISNYVDLRIQTDTETLYRQSFQTDDDPLKWKEVRFNKEWSIYQNVYDQDLKMTLKTEAKDIQIELLTGDWLNISSITLDSPNWEKPLIIEARSFDWGKQTTGLTITEDGQIDFAQTQTVIDKAYLFETSFKQWTTFTKQTGIPVVACEFGVYNKTDHATSLRVIEDHLALFNENQFGFALWNLTGAFGIFDSGRSDVTYELYEGHQLDREMLNLLKNY